MGTGHYRDKDWTDDPKRLNKRMRHVPNRVFVGLQTRLILALGIVLALFILITEVTVSSIIRISLNSPESDAPSHSVIPTTPPASHILNRIRKPILIYMITGAAITLLVAALAIRYMIIRPLSRINDIVIRYGITGKNDGFPINGSAELALLSSNINDMIEIIQTHEATRQQQLRRLEATNRDLIDTRETLLRSATLASVGTMASGVAHEIGNPIAGILGLLDALTDETSDDVRQQYQKLIKKEVRRVDKTIRDLLALARPPGQGQEAHPANVMSVLSHVKDLMTPQQQFREIALSFRNDTDNRSPLVLRASEQTVTALLVNLLLNSAQAMSGKGTIDISADVVPPPRDNSPTMIRISIKDSGPGVPPEHAHRIFEPFFSRRASGDGHGLGLAICQRICDTENGTIALNTHFTSGAQFVIHLPASTDPLEEKISDKKDSSRLLTSST